MPTDAALLDMIIRRARVAEAQLREALREAHRIRDGSSPVVSQVAPMRVETTNRLRELEAIQAARLDIARPS